MLLQVRLRGFAAKTVDAYLHAMEQLWAFYRRALERLSGEEVQRFLDEVITVRKLAWATVNVYFSAYRFLYEQALKRSPREFSIPRRGRSGKRPGILSREEVGRLLEAPRNLKHRALLSMTYGSGLRVSEVVRVRIRDIDRGRMMLRVEQGKGHTYLVATSARAYSSALRCPRRGLAKRPRRPGPCQTQLALPRGIAGGKVSQPFSSGPRSTPEERATPRTCAASAKPWESRLRRNGWNVQTIRSVPSAGKTTCA